MRKLSDYESDFQIGNGTGGVVKHAHDCENGGDVAVKIFYPNFIANHDLVVRELELHFQSRHPNIIRLLAVFDEENNNSGNFGIPLSGIVMEYCANRSVFDFLTSKSSFLTDTQKMIIFLGTADAMAYLHRNRICHRDLKPANILLNEKLYPKLCDFGFAKKLESGLSGQWSRILGTLHYMSPEVFLAKEEMNWFHADVYAYGMTLYHVITGQFPFQEKIPDLELGRKLSNGERPELPENLPKGLEMLIRRCWDQDSTIRPTFEKIVDILMGAAEEILLLETDREIFQEYAHSLHPNGFDITLELQGMAGNLWTCMRGTSMLQVREELATRCHLPQDCFSFSIGEGKLDLTEIVPAWSVRDKPVRVCVEMRMQEHCHGILCKLMN
jgi:serine/threonine protein kinase